MEQEDMFQWVANQAYYPRNLIAIVVRNLQPTEGDPDNVMAKSLRAALELHPVQIEGLTTGFTSSGDYQSQAVFTFGEKFGRPMDKLFHAWRYRFDQLVNLGPTDAATIDMMFIEPDPTYTKVSEAWLGKDLWPIDYNGIDSKRDIAARRVPRQGTANEVLFGKFKTRHYWPKQTKLELVLEGQYRRGEDVMEQAQACLSNLNIVASNPYNQTEFVNRISEEILAQS